jgi:hypothetical protein
MTESTKDDLHCIQAVLSAYALPRAQELGEESDVTYAMDLVKQLLGAGPGVGEGGCCKCEGKGFVLTEDYNEADCPECCQVNSRGDSIQSITPLTAPCSEIADALNAAGLPVRSMNGRITAAKVSSMFKRHGIEAAGGVVWKLRDGTITQANTYDLDGWKALLRAWFPLFEDGRRLCGPLNPPERMLEQPVDPTQWLCDCGYRNHQLRKVCRHCFKRRDAEPSPVPVEGVEDSEEMQPTRAVILREIVEKLRRIPVAISGLDDFHISELEDVLKDEVWNGSSRVKNELHDLYLAWQRQYEDADVPVIKELLGEFLNDLERIHDHTPVPPGTRTGRVDCSKPNLANLPKACTRFWIALYDTGDEEPNAFPIWSLDKPSDEKARELLEEYCEGADYVDLSGPWDVELQPVPVEPFWVIVYDHKHGQDVWPWFGSAPTEAEVVAEMATEGTEYEGPDNHEYLNFYGPFFVQEEDEGEVKSSLLVAKERLAMIASEAQACLDALKEKRKCRS